MRKLVFVSLLLLAGLVSAGQKITSGTLDIHYVVFNSNFLQPSVATAVGIERSGKLALLNVSLVRNGQGEKGQVSGTVTNLLGQIRQLEFKEIDEQTAVYYIAPIKLDSREVLKFDLRITDAKQQQHSFNFNQEVFPDQ